MSEKQSNTSMSSKADITPKPIRRDKAGKILSRVQGRFSKKEEAFMSANASKMSVTDMANHLNRDSEGVSKWLARHGIKNSDFYDSDEDRSRIKTELMAEPFWIQVQNQYTPNEQLYFIAQYCEHVIQMEKITGVDYSEKMQIMHLIRSEILMDRILERQKRAHAEEQKIYIDIAKLDPKVDAMEIKALRARAESCVHEFSSYSREGKDLQDRINALRKELKMTREQRIKDYQDVDKNFENLVKNMQHSKFRSDEGKEINAFRAAMEVEKRKLSEWHEFADGKADIPFLTPEVVDRLKRRKEA